MRRPSCSLTQSCRPAPTGEAELASLDWWQAPGCFCWGRIWTALHREKGQLPVDSLWGPEEARGCSPGQDPSPSFTKIQGLSLLTQPRPPSGSGPGRSSQFLEHDSQELGFSLRTPSSHRWNRRPGPGLAPVEEMKLGS